MLFEPIFEALNADGVRYVVVGGLATVLHGFARLTADIDLMVDLDPVETRKAIAALTRLGLTPRAPVDPMHFTDPDIREAWVRDKGMRVFSLWDPAQPMREVDLFVENPVDFEEVYARSELVPITRTAVRIASIADLVALKRLAGRRQDLEDIEALLQIEEARRERP